MTTTMPNPPGDDYSASRATGTAADVTPRASAQDPTAPTTEPATESITAARDLAALSAVEILGLHAADLMTASAVKLGLFEGGEADRDLAEARILIDAVAGLVNAAAPNLGHHHSAVLRDGVASLAAAFRELSPNPDAPGTGPGENPMGAGRARR